MTEPFRVIAADPPWPFDDDLPGKGRGARKHYDCLSIEDIKSFPLPPLADDAHLFLWRVTAMVEEAYQVVRAWGFEPKTELVWVKTAKGGSGLHMGMGRITRGAHETCIIARRGKPKVLSHGIRDVFHAGTGGRNHSHKPPEFYRIVEDLAEGPYVELFARVRRKGWAAFGNQLTPPPTRTAAE